MLSFLLQVLFVLCLATQRISARTRAIDPESQLLIDNDVNLKKIDNNDDDGSCTLDVNHDNFFDTLRKLEDDNKVVIAEFEKAVGPRKLNEALMQSILNSRGMSQQAIQQNLGRIDLIPAGIDLGGYCIIRMQESFLFFDRMKLRNSTNFKIQLVENDLKSLVVRTKLSLNDLHLQGSYERLMQDKKPSNLFYTPTQGVADIMLKDVEYKMEGRYRMMNDRIAIDIVVSNIRLKEPVIVTKSMSGQNKTQPFRLRYDQIEDLLQRMKGDLDTWIKDCFNDRLMTYDFGNEGINDKYMKYHKSKTAVDDNYLHYFIDMLHDRICHFKMEAVTLPDFTIFNVNGGILRIRNGALRGLDSIYKKSFASSYLDGSLRHVCSEIAFGNLQVSYTYEAFPETPKDVNNPALTGSLILSAKELTSNLVVGVMVDPNSVELSFQGIKQLGTESLTIGGAANREFGQFRHIIQKHVMALMSYSINFHVRNLKTLTDCRPNTLPYHEPGGKYIGPSGMKKKRYHRSDEDWWYYHYGDSESSSGESGSRDSSRSHGRSSSYEHKSSKEDKSKEDRSSDDSSNHNHGGSYADTSGEDTNSNKHHETTPANSMTTTTTTSTTTEPMTRTTTTSTAPTTTTTSTTSTPTTTSTTSTTTTTTTTTESNESIELLSQGQLLRNSRRHLNNFNHNRQLRRRFRPLRELV